MESTSQRGINLPAWNKVGLNERGLLPEKEFILPVWLALFGSDSWRLRLNDPKYIFRPGQMIAMLGQLEKRWPDPHRVWLGYPDQLPNLSRLRPPGGNDRPDGIEQSHFARHKRGELPMTY